MLNQEDIYQLMLAGKWTELLDILYQHRKTIASDPLLATAAKTLEFEFFRQIKDYAYDREDVIVMLETLFQLNHGKFYILSDENFVRLKEELAGRKPGSYQFLLAKPGKQQGKGEEAHLPAFENFDDNIPAALPDNWTEIYNRLYEIMNVQGDAATYFSGPRFINVVRQFKPYFPDYDQYIRQRNYDGKSTTRKIFYFDILKELNYQARKNTIDTILDIIRPYESERVNEIEYLLYQRVPAENKMTADGIVLKKPVVFISYSWDSEDHKSWVLNLANRLISDGVDVILDRMKLRAGSNLPHFVEQSIAKADKVLIIFTPNYKLKADQRAGGVGYEYSIMNAALYKNQTINEKIIPILRLGTQAESIPDFMHQYIHIDITKQENFENSYADLKRELFNQPAYFDS